MGLNEQTTHVAPPKGYEPGIEVPIETRSLQKYPEDVKNSRNKQIERAAIVAQSLQPAVPPCLLKKAAQMREQRPVLSCALVKTTDRKPWESESLPS